MRILAIVPVFLLVSLTGCLSGPKPRQEEPAPPEPVTGLHALAQMFSAARTWQPDVLVLRVTSLNAGKVKPQPGRAAAWQATFVSPAARQSRTYTFAVADVSTSIRQGIFPDPAAGFSASGQSAQAFSIMAAKKDTDEAYQTATEHAAKFIAEHPGSEINYILELNNRWADAAWRIIWGESASNNAFSVLVDASTGQFVRVLD